MQFILTWIATAIATLAAVGLIPGIEAIGGNYLGPVMCALALAIVNALVKPLLEFISLPITIVTLGIFSLIINALMLELASWLSVNVFGAGISISGFGSAFFGAIIISIVGAVIASLLGI